MTIDEAREHIGDGVVYKVYGTVTRHAWQFKTKEVVKSEDGIITSVNDTYVFVRYAGDHYSKATKPENLELLSI